MSRESALILKASSAAIIILLCSIIFFSFQAQAQIASINIQGHGVNITARYKEPVIFVSHTITNSSGAVFSFVRLDYSLHVSGDKNTTFRGQAYLPPGAYTYTITVGDDVNNQRTDSKDFYMLGTGPPPFCGNGITNLDAGEECDDGNNVSGDGCNSFCQIEKCGNNKVDLLWENCDGTDMNGMTECTQVGNFIGGTLTCRRDCFFNVSQCVRAPNSCGNRIVEPGEACDTNVPPSVKCHNLSTDFTFGQGSLSCVNCTYITRNCVGWDYGYCGDGTVEKGENCDWNNTWPYGIEPGVTCSNINPNFTGGILSCNRDCTFNTSLCIKAERGKFCGDGLKNLITEDCDGTSFGTTSCLTLGFTTGQPLCNECDLNLSFCTTTRPNPRVCGDGIVQAPNDAGFNEQCDGNAIPNPVCPPGTYSGGTVGCRGDCVYDYSKCINVSELVCRDGVVNRIEEECDLSDMGGATCPFFGYNSGIITCNFTTCKWIKTNCSNIVVPPSCGDGIKNRPTEQCDRDPITGLLDLNGFTCDMRDDYDYGNLNCTGSCTFDDSNCFKIPRSCPNGFLDPGEQCDPNTPVGTQKSIACTSLSSSFVGGTANCNNSCVYVTNLCTGTDPAGYCGDGIVVKGEQCEYPNSPVSKTCTEINRNFTGGTLTCGANCKYNTSRCTTEVTPVCGDKQINVFGEFCDGSDLGGFTCYSLGYSGGGTLRCNNDTCLFDASACIRGPDDLICGDGNISKPNAGGFYEECDGTNLDGKSCSSFNGYSGTGLACTSCIFDLSACTRTTPFTCQDGTVNRIEEECDIDDFDGRSCEFFGYDFGLLNCTSNCIIDSSGCRVDPKVCGDGIVQAPNDAKKMEECDQTNLNSKECTDLDNYAGGFLSCDTTKCSFDDSKCYPPYNTCGDGIIQPGENCDPALNQYMPCRNLSSAFVGDTTHYASCNATTCLWMTRSCTGPTGGFCGDGNVKVNESCDYNALDPIDGKTCTNINPKFLTGTVSCTNDCFYNTSQCSTVPPSTCGDGVLTPGYEQCDGNLFGPINDCRNFSQFVGGTLLCSRCQLNTSRCELPEPPPPGCGDGIRNFSSEECDDGNNIAWDGCSPYCKIERCGDNIINNKSEACDGTDLNGMTCTALGFPGDYPGGTLLCSRCQFNTSKCNQKISYCGDGKVQPGEDCDGSVPYSVRCTNLSSFFISGNPQCNPDTCKYATSGCIGPISGWCPDGNVSRGESCDTNVGGRTCSNINPAFLLGGSLTCRSDCFFDTTQCLIEGGNVCGDSSVLENEQCDDNGPTYDVFDSIKECTDLQSYIGGTLRCSNCMLNTTGCIPRQIIIDPVPVGCGDGVLNRSTEECDDGNNVSGDGCSASCLNETCNNNRIDAFELCDTNRLNGMACEDFGFPGGTLLCDRTCKFNTSKCYHQPIFCNDGILQPGETCDPGLSPTYITCRNLSSSFTISNLFSVNNANCNQSSCRWNTYNCQGPTDGWCGDGTVAKGEHCDPGLWNNGVGDKQCTDVHPNFVSGTLTCTDDCFFNTSLCVVGTRRYCGDGVMSPDLNEQCDGTSFGSTTCESLGYTGGQLLCNNCILNRSKCTNTTNPNGVCGDGIVKAPNAAGMMEQCDLTNLSGKNCTSWPLIYSGGSLGCNVVSCSYDYSNCIPIIQPQCQDGLRNRPAEQCDQYDFGSDSCMTYGFTKGNLTCRNDCTVSLQNCLSISKVCGDGIIQAPNDNRFNEQCDDKDFNRTTCMSLGYDAGNLSCRSDCRLDSTGCYNLPNFCGDGQIMAGEQCEGSQSIACNVLNPQFTSFNLATCIPSNCTYNTKNCNGPTQGRCGDNIVQTPNTAGFYEQCDGSVGNMQCSQVNPAFISGTLTCGANCLYNTTLCEVVPPRFCGDLAVNRLGEVCDGEDFAGTNCQSLGFASGNLTCNQATCQVNISGCIKASNASKVCGDGIVQKPNNAFFMEQCDGTNLSGRTCSSFTGYTGGILNCYSDCTFDYTGCTKTSAPSCQDGVRNQLSEECDRTDLVGLTCGFLGFTNGTLLCTRDCKLNKSLCSSTAGACGDGIAQQPNVKGVNEECDGSDLDGMSCGELGYDIGRLACKGDCSFDQSNCSYKEVDEGYCGDGILGGFEICDGMAWGPVTGCTSFSAYMGGNLACRHDNCMFDTTGCLPISPVPNASCYDLEKNGDETDLNCGGTCPPCINGRTCLIGGDCISNYCKNGLCAEASCEDSMMNGLETDIDCGGNCYGCAEGKVCSTTSDCLIGLFCHPFNRKCTTPSCNDGFQNGDETGVDCGGGCPLPCTSNEGCMSDRDCEQGMNCIAGKCISNSNQDTDGDGMPDWWENRYFLDPNDPSDAHQDLDGDGRTNLEEFIDGTDPTKPDGFAPKRRSSVPMILLIIGIVLMLLSTGFLIYSRKVLVPQQRQAAAARLAQQRAAASQQKPGLKPAGKSGASSSLAERLAQRQAARRSALKGFGDEKAAGKEGPSKPGDSSSEGRKADASKKPKDEFIPISKLGKLSRKEKHPVSGDGKDEKSKGGIFERLREFTLAYRKTDKGKGAGKDAAKDSGKSLSKDAAGKTQPDKKSDKPQAEKQDGNKGSDSSEKKDGKKPDEKDEPKQLKG